MSDVTSPGEAVHKETEVASLEGFCRQANIWIARFRSTEGNLSKIHGELTTPQNEHLIEADLELGEAIQMYKKFLANFDSTISVVGGKDEIRNQIGVIWTKVDQVQKNLEKYFSTKVTPEEASAGSLQLLSHRPDDTPEDTSLKNHLWFTHFLLNKVGDDRARAGMFDEKAHGEDKPSTWSSATIAKWSKNAARLNKDLFDVEHV